MTDCQWPKCERSTIARGYCGAHYVMARRQGLIEPLARVPLHVKYGERIADGPNGCWLWTGTLTTAGYGTFCESRKLMYAHRWAYEYFVSQIPDGFQIDHLCRVRNCVRPDHLEAVPQRINVARQIKAKYGEVCKHGHRWTPESTYLDPQGSRRCRVCAHSRSSALAAERKAERHRRRAERLGA